MPIQTRYFRGDQHTVNGLTAYILGTSQSATAQSYTIFNQPVAGFYYGIRVWKRASDGTETEITSGTPVAQVFRSINGSGLQSATWDCPETSLTATDAILVRLYIKGVTTGWYLAGEFITEQLGAQTLDAATWTVYYYTSQVYNPRLNSYNGSVYWGTSEYNTHIEGFSYTVAVAVAYPVGDGLTFAI